MTQSRTNNIRVLKKYKEALKNQAGQQGLGLTPFLRSIVLTAMADPDFPPAPQRQEIVPLVLSEEDYAAFSARVKEEGWPSITSLVRWILDKEAHPYADLVRVRGHGFEHPDDILHCLDMGIFSLVAVPPGADRHDLPGILRQIADEQAQRAVVDESPVAEFLYQVAEAMESAIQQRGYHPIMVFRQQGFDWEFCYPRVESRSDIMDKFDAAVVARQQGKHGEAEAEYREILAEFPEFLDAAHHLAVLLSDIGNHQEAFRLWQRASAMGLNALPPCFEIGQDRLPWDRLNNRPFFRAYKGFGLKLLAGGETRQALEVFEDTLALNPRDNQGVRACLVGCYLELGRPADVVALRKRYTSMEYVLYGYPLALFQLDRREEAAEALREVIGRLPLIAKELLKEDHPIPDSRCPGRVTYGGEDQAYMYWEEHGKYWENTPGALDFLRKVLQSS